ncbi:hypothetical protein [Arthrobacter ulcerisalmonis]|nr:hypothetical protein [Arthrobacter ulcerisalmonis]
MASDEEKDPPVPADLANASKRIHRVEVEEEHDQADKPSAPHKP